ncbi:PorP/SprF family type IX secretion system membrane protein [bacterium]|nr:PorP/SprF family type IX secretion system membrane protein [Flavobacteriales bacterium]MDB4678339.1 PorP/SprF family type IX secretion system membrane protein [bacterium]
MLRVAILTILLGFSLHMRAQDAQFSQSFSNPMYLNPAFAGYDGCPTIRTAYRNQWPNISGNFQTVNVSYDQLLGKRHGIGINYKYDNAANTLESHTIDLIYAPVFRFFHKQLAISPAFTLGLKYRSVNFDKLTFGDMIDPRYGFVYTSQQQESANDKLIGDLSTGLILSWKGLVAGFAAHHITQPDEGFTGLSKLPVRLTGHINYVFNINERIKISPAFLFQKQQDFKAMLPSFAFEAYGARIGAGVRTSFTNPDAVVFMLGYRGHGFKVGYTYDYTVSSLTNNTGGSHEVSLGFVVNCKKKEFRKGVSQINF